MEEDGFLSNILLEGHGAPVAAVNEVDDIPESQDSPSSVEVVQPSRSTKGGKRSKNFTPEEDEIVCFGWLAISKDPINGANQSRTTFWGKVHAYFEEHNKSKVPRSESSIMHRFLVIQTSVNKFCSHYDQILRRNQSGTTMQDKVCNLF